MRVRFWRKKGGGMEPPRCPRCGALLAAEQEWCVNCGERLGSDLRARAGLFSVGLLGTLGALLVSGAAAAGVVALNEGPEREPPHRLLVIKKLPVAAGGGTAPGEPETLHVPSGPSAEPTPPSRSFFSPSAPTPGQRAATQSSSNSSQSQATTTTASSTTAVQRAAEPIQLEGYQLSVYNPHNSYPSADFTNPRREFEEGSQLLWQVTVHPGGARRIGVGLLVKLERPLDLAALELRTQTPGFGYEVLGATEGPLPPTRASNRWTVLAKVESAEAVKTVPLARPNIPHRYLLLWLTTVPRALAGTASAPGKVKIEEVALFPPNG